MPRTSVPKWFVSRQRYWGEDESCIVEVAAGGLDYANPDMLGVKFPASGEGQEYTDPREAARAAIDVCTAWRNHGEPGAHVAHGATGGFMMPFSPCSFEELLTWAESSYERLDKCGQCGDILGQERFGDGFSGEYDCCSESCAEKYYADVEPEPDEEADETY